MMEFVRLDHHPVPIGENKIHGSNHQPVIRYIYINKKQLKCPFFFPYQMSKPPESILPCPPKIHQISPPKNPPKEKSPPSCRHPRPQAGDEVLQVGHSDVARGAAAWRGRTGRWKVVEFDHEKMGILP
jgi:hypothetical protein